MKNKVLKAMACAMSVCMLSMSLAGCGNGDDQGSSTPSGSSDTPTTTQESQGGTESDTPDDSQGEAGGIGADRSNGLYPAYDLGGVTLTVLSHNDIASKDPDQEGIEDHVKAERQDVKDYIEAKYNVHLEFVPLPTDDYDSIAKEITQAYISGNPVADIMHVSYNFMATYISNDILYDYTQDFANSDQFNPNEYLEWYGKVWGISRGMGGEGIYTNNTLIRELGMQYTPAEMFDRGMWSYDDCLAYLKELKSLMGEDEYPIFVSPGYWLLFAPHANGVKVLDDFGNLNYCTEPMLECMEFYKTLIDEKLNAIPAYTKEDGTTGYNNWGYAGDTFDKGHTVAMSHRGAWQAEGVVKSEETDFEVGFVPYPWGSNVTIDESKVGQEGAYLTLSDNYMASYFDGQLMALTKGTEEKANPVHVMSMLLEWMKWDSAMAAYHTDDETRTCAFLEDGIDKDVYFYCQDRQRLATYNAIDIEFELGKTMNKTFYEGGSVRSYFESCYNPDMQMMIDRGYATEDVLTPVEGEEGSEGGEEDTADDATE